MFFFKMVRRAFLAFLLIVIIGVGALEFAAKSYAETKLEEIALEKNVLAQSADAKVSVPLLYGIIVNGKINRVEISTTQVDVGPFLADRATAILRGIRLDRLATLADREPAIESIDVIEMILEFNSNEASKILPDGFAFEFLRDGKVRLSGPGADVVGRLVIVDGPIIRFDPDAGGSLPHVLGTPSWRFDDIPFVTCVSKIEIIAPLARITCVERDPPPKFPPG